MKILLVYPESADAVDGIRDYAVNMVAQLREEGDEAGLLRPKRGVALAVSLIRALPKRDPMALIVQYNPFSWGQWGVAPILVLALSMVRLRRRNVRVILMIHEGYVPMRNARWRLMGLWQRAQLRVLLSLAHGALATTGRLASELSRAWPRRRVGHLPVGSNVPDERALRKRARTTAPDGALVIATFTSGHETHLHAFVLRAAEAIARTAPEPIVLLLLGSNNLPPHQLESVARTVAPGYLEGAALARMLSSADVFLAPFADGATTRRTTLMAAIQHEIATITTVSDATETVLKSGGALALAAADDVEQFVAQAVRIANDASLRKQRARAGRALYERHFAWPVVCAGLRAEITASSGTIPQ